MAAKNCLMNAEIRGKEERIHVSYLHTIFLLLFSFWRDTVTMKDVRFAILTYIAHMKLGYFTVLKVTTFQYRTVPAFGETGRNFNSWKLKEATLFVVIHCGQIVFIMRCLCLPKSWKILDAWTTYYSSRTDNWDRQFFQVWKQTAFDPLFTAEGKKP